MSSTSRYHQHDSMLLFLVLIPLGITLFCPASNADTYEFELTRELAEAPSRKIDFKGLQKQPIGPGEIVKRDAQPKWKAPEKSTVIVKTGPNSLSILGKDYCRIMDFKSKKLWDLNTTKKTYYSQSLYADLAFRKAELNNRIFLHAMLGSALKGKLPADVFDPFFSEEMFSMQLADKNSGYRLSKTKTGPVTSYKYKEAVVTSFTPNTAPLSGEKLRQFSRFLIYGTYLHPLIRVDIEKTGKCIQKLSCFLDNQPVLKERSTLSLKKVTPGEYSAAVPEGFVLDSDPRNPLSSVYARIKELGGKPPADLKQLTLDYYKKAVENKNYLDALLCLTEYGLQTGENLGEEMKEIRDQLKDDPDCQKLVAGLATPANEQQAMLYLGSLDMIDRSKSAKSYLIDVFRANIIINMSDHGMKDVKTSQESDPRKAFIKVLEQNPFIAGVYHDLGKYLESCYMQSYAWECYDLARKFYPKHPFMEEISEKEQDLAHSFPQFFSGDKL